MSGSKDVLASEIVDLIRRAFEAENPYAKFMQPADVERAQELQALAVGHVLLDDVSDWLILKLARRVGTLRGSKDTGLTYHEVKCEICGGLGVLGLGPCPTCNGDGFAPPVEK